MDVLKEGEEPVLKPKITTFEKIKKTIKSFLSSFFFFLDILCMCVCVFISVCVYMFS